MRHLTNSGTVLQLPDEAMARAPLGPAPSEVLHPSTRFLNDDGTRGGGVPTGRSEASGGGRPIGGGMPPNMGHVGTARGSGGMGGYGQVYSDPGLAAMYSQTQHQQRAPPSPLPQQLLAQQQMLGAQMDLRSGYSGGDMRPGYGGPSFRQSPGPQHSFDAHPPPPPPRQAQQQQPWQGQADPPLAAGLPLHGGLNAFQQPPQQQSIASPSPQSPETSSQSGSHTYHFGQMQGALTDAAAMAPPAALGDVGDVPDPDALRACADRDLRQ